MNAPDNIFIVLHDIEPNYTNRYVIVAPEFEAARQWALELAAEFEQGEQNVRVYRPHWYTFGHVARASIPE